MSLTMKSQKPRLDAPPPRWRRTRRASRWLCCLAMPLWLGACVLAPPRPGVAQADVLRDWGMPTGRHSLAAGGLRLEYATGPFGKSTWMIDLNAAGLVTRARQVLSDPYLAEFQARAPGLTRVELLREMGRPGERVGGGRQGGEVWSWRYQTNECLWFRVGLGDDGLVRDAVYAIDPSCDSGDSKPS